MAVAVDARSSGQGTVNSTQVTSFNHTTHTVGSGSNRALIYVCSINYSTAAEPTGVTAVWDSAGANQSMTLLATGTNITDINHANGFGGSQVFIFGLRNPASGNKTISVSWTGGNSIVGGAISLTGVDQSSDVAAFPGANNATANNGTVNLSVTSATGDWTVFGLIAEGSATFGVRFLDSTVDASGTLYLDDDNCFGYDFTGAPTVTLSGAVTGPTNWAACGVDIAAAGAGADVLMPQISL